MSTIRYLIRDAWLNVKLASFRSKWRSANKHNYTFPNNVFPIEKVTVGKETYADLNVYSYRNKEEQLTIGNFCSIASDVIFVLSGEHNMKLFSTYPFAEKYYGENGSAICKGPIVVEDDVWIGVRVTVLSGVTIGKGAVIGAGSIVNKDVPPYSVYAGTKVIGKRFDSNLCEKVSTISFESLNYKMIEKIMKTEIRADNVDEVIKCANQR